MKYLSELLLLTLSLILILIILDRVFNRFRITSLFVDIWLSIFVVIKRIGSWKGLLSFGIVWLILSGIGLAIVGIIIKSKVLIAIGGAIFLFWAGPFTPLVPLVIALTLVFQRYIFRDKSISLTLIKDTFKEVRQKVR